MSMDANIKVIMHNSTIYLWDTSFNLRISIKAAATTSLNTKLCTVTLLCACLLKFNFSITITTLTFLISCSFKTASVADVMFLAVCTVAMKLAPE